MPSLQSRLLNFTLRNRHLLKFQLKKDVIDWDTSIPDLRQQHEKSSRSLGKMPEGMQVIAEDIEGMHAEWIIPEGTTRDRVILYVHGGGYVSGSCEDHRAIVAKLVQQCGICAMTYDYRLAPEHPFPAALQDSVRVYRWLLAQGILPKHIVIAGESAGGGLCLATLLELKQQGIPLPAAGVALSPWADLTFSGESYKSKARVCLSPAGSWDVFGQYYTGDNDPTNPGISPLFGDMHGLPPLLIYSGDDEVMRDDAVQFAEKAKSAGVAVKCKIWDGMVHCFPFFAPLVPEAREAMDDICTFMKVHLN